MKRQMIGLILMVVMAGMASAAVVPQAINADRLGNEPASAYSLVGSSNAQHTLTADEATNALSLGGVAAAGYALDTATNSVMTDSLKLGGVSASGYATVAATGTITDQGVKTTNSPTFAAAFLGGLRFKGISSTAVLLLTTPAVYDVYLNTDSFKLYIATAATAAGFKTVEVGGATD